MFPSLYLNEYHSFLWEATFVKKIFRNKDKKAYRHV